MRRGQKDEENQEMIIMSLQMPKLPNDVLFDILLRLDIKTLGRCGCVCKRLKEAISSPRFIDIHRHQSLSRDSPKLLFIGKYKDKAIGRYVWTFTMVDPNDDHMDSEGGGGREAASGVDRSVISSIDSKRLSICFARKLPVGCDLLCFWNYFDETIKLCNPRTGLVRSLPTPSDIKLMRNLAFGYDASKREYTLVSLRTNPTKIIEEGKVLARKFTFSAGNSLSSSVWKDIEEGCPRFVGRGLLINSFMYWLIESSEPLLATVLDKFQAYSRRKNEVIVSLDLDTQKFEIIRCPPTPTWESHPDLNSTHITMIDFKGTLCLTDTLAMGRTNVLELWALESNSCWENKYNIQLGFPVSGPRGRPPKPVIHYKSSNEGELIMSSDVDGKFYLYNPETRTVRVARQPHQTCTKAISDGHLIPNFFWESLVCFPS